MSETPITEEADTPLITPEGANTLCFAALFIVGAVLFAAIVLLPLYFGMRS